jgi:hypothetical protein
MANSTGVKDAGNIAVANVPFTTGESYEIAPKVLSINRDGDYTASGSSLSWTVTLIRV